MLLWKTLLNVAYFLIWTTKLLLVNLKIVYFLGIVLILGTENGCLNQYDLRNFHDAVNFAQPHKQRIRDLQVSYNQGLLISSSSDRTAQLHDANTLDSLKTYT